ncbi:MAG: FKBP-type peptidyl-prolyl cis-trans isomerase [Bacteroidetes bacterium]|nr:FKBP-type peptidyl-prolyl cis-trans isomerase [Bacteroidota bacterium]
MIKDFLNYIIALGLFLASSVFILSCQKELNQADIDNTDIIEYVEANQLEGQFTSSGLWYMISELGNTDLPTIDSKITLGYISYLLNGNSIDSSNDTTLTLKDAIPGLQEGLQLIGDGGVIKLIIPSDLAYGPGTYPDVPANSILVFDIFVKGDSINHDSIQAAIDKAIILKYVEEQQLDGQFTDSGLYYVIIEPGSNNHPTSYSEITVDYFGYLLNGDELDSGINLTFSLHSLILGWQEGLQLIGTGGEIKLIIPSGLAYGSGSPSGIPAHSILVFDITLDYFSI